MPVENLRVIVLGVPRHDENFVLMQRDKRDTQRLAEEIAKASGDAKADLERQLRDALRSGR